MKTSVVGGASCFQIPDEETGPLLTFDMSQRTRTLQQVTTPLESERSPFKVIEDKTDTAPKIGQLALPEKTDEKTASSPNKSVAASDATPDISFEIHEDQTETAPLNNPKSEALIPDLSLISNQNMSVFQPDQQGASISCFKIYEDKTESGPFGNRSALIDLSRTGPVNTVPEEKNQTRDERKTEPKSNVAAIQLESDLEKSSVPSTSFDCSLNDISLLKPLQNMSINEANTFQNMTADSNQQEHSRFSIENPNTEMFSIDVATIKNSTILSTPLRMKGFQAMKNIQEQSLHIKEEPETASGNATNMGLNISIDLMDHERQTSAIQMMISEPRTIRPSVFQRDSPSSSRDLAEAKVSNDSVIEIVDDDTEEPEHSIYVKQPPKDDTRLSFGWDPVADANKEENNYDFAQIELDRSQLSALITEEVNPQLNPFFADLQIALLQEIQFTDYIKDLPSCQLIRRVPPIISNSPYVLNNVEFDIQKVIGRGSFGFVYRYTV